MSKMVPEESPDTLRGQFVLMLIDIDNRWDLPSHGHYPCFGGFCEKTLLLFKVIEGLHRSLYLLVVDIFSPQLLDGSHQLCSVISIRVPVLH